MIFLTVGTVMPFDRLVRALDDAVGDGAVEESVFAQVGRGGYRPRNIEWVETLERDRFRERLSAAHALIAHAGTGTIFMALERLKPILVMPRLSRLGEHVNDHQVATAREFAALGHILVADDAVEMRERLKELGTFAPAPRRPRVGPVVRRVKGFLDEVAQRRARGRTPSTCEGTRSARRRSP